MIQATHSLLLLLALSFTSPATAEDLQPQPQRLAVRSASPELLDALKGGSFERWVLPNNQHLKLVTGGDASGDVDVLVQVLPAEGDFEAMLKGLPVRFEEGAIYLGETRYDDPTLRLAMRLPSVEKPTWLVTAHDAESAAYLVDRVLMVASGVRFYRRGTIDKDYLLLEHSFSERSGLWQKREDGSFGLDPDERDDLASRAAFYGAQKSLKRKHVTLRVDPDRAADPALVALATQLDQAAERMARRIPLRLKEPIEIVIEDNFESQGRHLNELGAGVVRKGRLHVVFHPEDEDAIRYGLARSLIRRAGLELSPWLEDGAALWLSEGWFGRPWQEWPPLFAAAEVMPTGDQLYATKRQEDSSDVIWPPVAAALVDMLEGETLKDRLDPRPSIEDVRKKSTQVHILGSQRIAQADSARTPGTRSLPERNLFCHGQRPQSGLPRPRGRPAACPPEAHGRRFGVAHALRLPAIPNQASPRLPERSSLLRDRRRCHARRPTRPRSGLSGAVETPHLGFLRELAWGHRHDQRSRLEAMVERLPTIHRAPCGAR